MSSPFAGTTYVLPILRTAAVDGDDLPDYLAALSQLVPVIVVDGSAAPLFARHRAAWPKAVLHVAVDDDRRRNLNGKVAGVVTGLRRVRTGKAIVADDDVRYDPFALRRMTALLDDADVVRPQNVFSPMPWHALIDTGRSLIARLTGGDWPGTLGLRMECYNRAGGYDGDVLFENLELVRTLRAVGGREHVAYDLFVARRPPTTAHFRRQRLRQAYDEFARPAHFMTELAAAPLLALAARRWGMRAVVVAAVGAALAAEAGRRRGGGAGVFPPTASLCAPLWAVERALTAWAALALRMTRGGVRYSRGTLGVAAHSVRTLRARYAGDVA